MKKIIKGDYFLNDELEFKDLINVMKVCKKWKHTVESISNLIIDLPTDFIVDKDLSVLGVILIRARNISSKSGNCLSAKKVTFVADQINYLGRIKALT